MDLTGKVISVLEEQKFNGRNGEIVKHGFVIETGGQYPKKVKFDVLGADRWERMQHSVSDGADVQVFFDVESRQWKESWFTSCNCYRVSAVGGGVQRQDVDAVQNGQRMSAQEASQEASQSSGSDLPF